MMQRAVLFDLDGTLVNTIGLWAKAYLQTLREVGVKIDAEEFMQTIYTQNLHFELVLKHYGLDTSRADSFRAIRDERYAHLLRTEPLWLEGAEDLLKEIIDTYETGIVTGSHLHYIEAIEEQLPLRSLVPLIITCDDTKGRSKPHPYGLLLACEKLGVEPEECVYIGDQEFDIAAANNANMTSCLVWTEHTPATAGQEADIAVQSLAEIPAALSLH
jgi:HAD superfamily hydrolase (TIGR01549 family)